MAVTLTSQMPRSRRSCCLSMRAHNMTQTIAALLEGIYLHAGRTVDDFIGVNQCGREILVKRCLRPGSGRRDGHGGKIILDPFGCWQVIITSIYSCYRQEREQP